MTRKGEAETLHPSIKDFEGRQVQGDSCGEKMRLPQGFQEFTLMKIRAMTFGG